MPWMNRLQLGEAHSDPIYRRQFAGLFGLRTLMAEAVLPEGYSPPVTIADSIDLTSLGQEWASRIRARDPGISAAEVRLALFVRFFHNDLFVDVKNTNSAAIDRFLDTEIVRGRLRYPWVYGRVLYDRFFETFSNRTDHLSYEETVQLLGDTPTGVFQIGDVVVGPMGALHSSARRYLPPLLELPLWHCSDPSCRAFHVVQLSAGVSKVSEAIDFVSAEAERRDGPASEWGDFFLDSLDLPEDYYDDMNPGQFPWLLANAFDEGEYRCVVAGLLRRCPQEVKERFPATERFERMLHQPPQIASRGLNQAECLQLMLLMPDEAIIGSLEHAIEEDDIHIPPTEIRDGTPYTRPSGWLRVSWQCSRFGVRAVAATGSIALPRLNRLIRNLYAEPTATSQLRWKLRHVEGEKLDEKLDNYLHIESPQAILANLVLDTEEHVANALKALRFPSRGLPSSPEGERRLVETMLWKLGFDVPLYPGHQQVFWNRLERFREIAAAVGTATEDARESVRSVGANFFVSLEEILDYSLSFATWALLSDHYGATKFTCNLDDARRFMAARLNGCELGSGTNLELDRDGKNSLYPLTEGFAALARLCRDTMAKREELRRGKHELPGYCGKTEVQAFPFLHKVLLLDLREEDQERLVGLLADVTSDFDRHQICSLRNRIEHRRPDFPTAQEIQAACAGISETVRRMEEAGLCALTHFYSGTNTDAYGRSSTTLTDYAGRQVLLARPTQFEFCGLPPTRCPQIVVPWMHIGDNRDSIRFRFEETSTYVSRRRNYPRRKPRLPPEPGGHNTGSGDPSLGVPSGDQQGPGARDADGEQDCPAV